MRIFPKLFGLTIACSALALGQATISSAPLPNGEVGFVYSTTLAATGGSPPYTNWIVSTGALPQGLTLNNLTGVISGTPLNVFTSSFTITVRDSTATTSAPQNFSIAIGSPVRITGPSALPGGIVGLAYPPPGGGVTFSSTGGWPPQTWSATGLPPGMSINTSGLLSGTPTVQGSYTPQFTVTDAIGATASVTLPLAITALARLQITTVPALAPATVGTFYSQLLLATGGTVPYGWALASGTLPPGLSLSSNGEISGTPTTTGSSTFTAKVTDAASSSQAQTFTITVGLPLIGSMPHLAAEGGWSTTFTILNKSAAPLQAQFNMFDNAGNPLGLPISFPQIFPPPPLAASLSSASTTLPGNASWIIQASGPTGVPFVEGAAQLSGVGNLDGFAIFHFDPSQQEAVVPMETRNASSYLLPFDNTNGVLTGVALANVSGTAANIPVIVRSDSGSQTLVTNIALPAYGHTSFVLSAQYPLLTTNTRGTLEFDTPNFGSANAGRISVLGIRYTGGTLTTIPALANVGTNGGLMAHLAAGSGWQTTFALVNTGSAPATATVNFFGDSGSLLPLPLTVLTGVNSTTLPGFQTGFTQTIPANGTAWVQTAAPAGNALQVGSAQLAAGANVSGYAIFRYNPNGQEAVVPLESRSAGSYVIAFDQTNNTATGIAISSGATLPIAVPVILRDDAGNVLGNGTVPLNAAGHASFVLGQQYPQTAGIRGTAEFVVPASAAISVLGIRSPPALTFTTLPALAK
jgi:Putative Ig domain